MPQYLAAGQIRGNMRGMQIAHAIVLGIVEGLTEFVPVSSTGHLIIVDGWLGGGGGEGDKAFEIVIQGGALLACICYYLPVLKRHLLDMPAGAPNSPLHGRRLLSNLGIAAVPALALGLVAGKQIKALLFAPAPVAAALAVGGVLMIALDLLMRGRATRHAVEDVDWQTALRVGFYQCLALIPGTSRSMATIAGGQLCGLDARAAADFSFLLAIPVLGAAVAHDILKHWHALLSEVGGAAITGGLVTSFVFGWASIAGFLKLISRVGLLPFGIYRIVLAAVVLVTLP